MNLNTKSILNTISETLYYKKLKNAMNIEMQVLEKKIQEMMDLPKGKKLMGYKWIFIIKYKVDGQSRDIKQDQCKRLYIGIWDRLLEKIYTNR